MHVNLLGPVTALAAFLGIWIGHVSVRRIEYLSPSLDVPAALFISFGLGLEFASTQVSSLGFSAACGILGTTLLWDALELRRQERRVRKGHAPANPRNPRHARILAESPAATTLNLLKREPLGRPVPPAQASELVPPRS